MEVVPCTQDDALEVTSNPRGLLTTSLRRPHGDQKVRLIYPSWLVRLPAFFVSASDIAAAYASCSVMRMRNGALLN